MKKLSKEQLEYVSGGSFNFSGDGGRNKWGSYFNINIEHTFNSNISIIPEIGIAKGIGEKKQNFRCWCRGKHSFLIMRIFILISLFSIPSCSVISDREQSRYNSKCYFYSFHDRNGYITDKVKREINYNRCLREY